MTQKVLGPTGSKRRHRTLVLLPFAALIALVLAIMGSAANGPAPVNFEIEGNLEAGSVLTGTAVGSDWINLDAGNGGLGALMCPSNASSCAVDDVVDGPALGEGVLFRDDLKVDPGGDDTTFTQGDKENDFANITDPAPPGGVLTSDTPWHIVEGSIPPQKDDLFDIAVNTYIAGANAELDLGMLRTNNNGSSHVDFELNRLSWLPGATTGVDCLLNDTNIANFKCPVRTEGDVLISFEISPSSTTPPVAVQTRLFVWDLPGGTDANGHGRGNNDCEGPLTGNENTCPWEEIAIPSNGGQAVVTAANAAQIAAGPWGSREPDGDATSVIPPGGWFEAAIDLDRLGFSPSCPGFGTMSAKSRSSGSSVTSALTDLAGPFPVDLDVCGELTIVKDAQPNGAQDFSYTTTGGLSPSTFDLDDDADATLSNTRVYDPLSPGVYTVTESAPGGGYAFSAVTCVVNNSDAGDPTTYQVDNTTRTATVDIGNFGDVTCTFVNVLQRSLIISKVAKDFSTATAGPEPQGGVTFGISPNPTGGAGAFSVTDDGAGDQFASTAGKICVDLATSVTGNSFTITETVPTGYAVVGTNPRTGVAPAQGTCATRGTSATADAAFVNNPLSKFTIDFDYLAPGANNTGATAASITCTGISPTPADATPANNVFDDNVEVYTNLPEGTYNCQIIIDP